MPLIDLSQKLQSGSLSYPGTASGVTMEAIDIGVPGSTLTRFSHLDPHCGTHFDAPLHFAPDMPDVAAVLLRLPEVVVIQAPLCNVPAKALDGIENLEGKAVLFSTGWDAHAGTPFYFRDFPTLDPALAQRLADERVGLVGVDGPSVDPAAGGYVAHRTLLGAGIPIVEGLVRVADLLPHLEAGHRVRLAAFPLAVEGLEGSPVRAVALVDDSP